VGDRVVAISREGWLRRSVHPAVRDLIARAAAAQPDRPIEIRATSRNTVVAAALWRGYKSICLNLYDKQNDVPYVYQLTDTIAQLQLPALNAAQELGWQLLQQIDRG
jgi:predicted RNA-binding protein associated with RNAse of E/G family